MKLYVCMLTYKADHVQDTVLDWVSAVNGELQGLLLLLGGLLDASLHGGVLLLSWLSNVLIKHIISHQYIINLIRIIPEPFYYRGLTRI